MTNDNLSSLYTVSEGAGRCQVSLTMLNTGRGWVGSLTGGEVPHVGGIVLATPRPSLQGTGGISCDLSSVPVPNHLDNEVGIPVAKVLCIALQSVVSLSSGIHIDDAQPEELRIISHNCLAAAERFLAERD